MPGLREAQLRHATYYEDVLHSADDLYKRGGESIKLGLALFEQEWANVQTGQAWAAAQAMEDGEAAQLCNLLPQPATKPP